MGRESARRGVAGAQPRDHIEVAVPGRQVQRVDPTDIREVDGGTGGKQRHLAVGETVTLLHPLPPFSRGFNSDGEGMSVK